MWGYETNAEKGHVLKDLWMLCTVHSQQLWSNLFSVESVRLEENLKVFAGVRYIFIISDWQIRYPCSFLNQYNDF